MPEAGHRPWSRLSREAPRLRRTLQGPEHGPHRAGVEADQSKRQRNQLVDPVGNGREVEPFEDGHVVFQERTVRGEVYRVERVDARRVDSDQANALDVERIDQLWREGREVFAE